MPHWTDDQTAAHTSVSEALIVVDNVIGYMAGTQGKPSDAERALFAAAIVFIYGIWESFIEQLAIELAEKVSAEIEPEKVPKPVRQIIEKRTPWELSVTPGWRKLWSEHVRLKALGDETDEANKHGMNTAREGQVSYMLSLACVADPFKGFPVASIPPYLAAPKKNAKDAVNELVTLRGSIVHTGKVPETLRKGHVRAWRKFVEDAAAAIDQACRAECKALLC